MLLALKEIIPSELLSEEEEIYVYRVKPTLQHLTWILPYFDPLHISVPHIVVKKIIVCHQVSFNYKKIFFSRSLLLSLSLSLPPSHPRFPPLMRGDLSGPVWIKLWIRYIKACQLFQQSDGANNARGVAWHHPHHQSTKNLLFLGSKPLV